MYMSSDDLFVSYGMNLKRRIAVPHMPNRTVFDCFGSRSLPFYLSGLIVSIHNTSNGIFNPVIVVLRFSYGHVDTVS